jgi:glutathione peroxidase-family protein
MERRRIALLLASTAAVGVLSCLLCDAWTSSSSSTCLWTRNRLYRRLDLATSSSSLSLSATVQDENNDRHNTGLFMDRRQMGAVVASTLASLTAAVPMMMIGAVESAHAATDDDGAAFADIAARAQRLSQQVDATRPATTSSTILATNKTIYDFTLPVAGSTVPFQTIVRQQPTSSTVEGGEAVGNDNENNNKLLRFRDGPIKAIIVVNIKQDDPVARKDIPELMAIATKYGGAVAIVACPTDQGYYEPDTSQLLRLKLASEYGYGINPSTVVTDKINVLGSAAHPFWRWIQSTCRTPAGLGRLQGNFEKFLVDGRTGLPVRRYPRKYRPLNMVNDIEALVANKPLPPAGANYLEEWRTAATEAQTNTYRFEKGLNYFDGAP